MRILIADDHPFIRRGIKQIVADEVPGSVLGEAQTCPEVLQSVRNGAWDLVVLDLAMPGGDGLEVLRQIKASKPKLPVLVLTMHTEDQFGVLVMREGAAGYLTKRAAPDELVKAIRKISEGSKYITSTLAEKLAHEIDKGTDKPLHKLLSTREFQVFIQLAEGRTVDEIANELSISDKTVRQFRARLLRKMGLKNNVDLARYAMQNDLVS
jgi:two-component system, NarL family, invasion response regulator UvrY